MTLCTCAVALGTTLRGRAGCTACGGRGVVATGVSSGRWAELAAAGWRVEGEALRHPLYGTARVEVAVRLMDDDAKSAKRAAERTTT